MFFAQSRRTFPAQSEERSPPENVHPTLLPLCTFRGSRRNQISFLKFTLHVPMRAPNILAQPLCHLVYIVCTFDQLVGRGPRCSEIEELTTVRTLSKKLSSGFECPFFDIRYGPFDIIHRRAVELLTTWICDPLRNTEAHIWDPAFRLLIIRSYH
jgi:hypothetical protein